MENIELSEVCFEHVKDTFYYGLFGDFKLVIDKSTGCFNATKLCDAGGKSYYNWSRLDKSKKLFEYYQNLRPSDLRAEERNWRSDLAPNLTYEIQGNNKDKIERYITGTYVPKELILDIASWVSVEFYDRCNNIIINYFVKEFKKMDNKSLKKKVKEVEKQMEKLTLEKETVIKEKDDKIDELKAIMLRQEQLMVKQDQEREKDREVMLKQEQEREKDREIMLRQEQYMRSLGISLEEVKDQNEELLDKNEELLGKTKGLEKKANKIQRKLGIAVEDRAPQPEDESKRERFVLLKRNDSDYLPYYVIRAQDSYTTRKLKTERLHFPKLKVLLDIKCNPNSKTYYIRTKETLKSRGVAFKHNNIDLEDSKLSEQDLIEELKAINDSKRDV